MMTHTIQSVLKRSLGLHGRSEDDYTATDSTKEIKMIDQTTYTECMREVGMIRQLRTLLNYMPIRLYDRSENDYTANQNVWQIK